MRGLLLGIAIVLFLSATVAWAETVYVDDKLTITFRSGPGMDRKIIEYLTTGDHMELLQDGEEWALVRLPDGQEGWVMKQYITKTKPSTMQVADLQQANSNLTSRSDELAKENETLKATNQKVNAALAEKTKALADLTTEFNDLKQSSDASSFQMRKYLIFFFSGAGILFIGILLGLVMKRQRRKSMYMI
jgi:SH3 domain protein